MTHPEPILRRPDGPALRAAPAALEVRKALAFVAAFLGLGAVAALAASLAFTPAEIGAGAVQEWLGLVASPCPGCPLCGLSRAFAHLGRAEAAAALELNPLVALAYPAALACAAGLPFALRACCRRERCAS